LISRANVGPWILGFSKISFERNRKRQKVSKSLFIEFPWRRRGAKRRESKVKARYEGLKLENTPAERRKGCTHF